MSELIRGTKILFNADSIHGAGYGLTMFSFRRQATIQAVDLAPGDQITFEVVHFDKGTPDELCGCFIAPGEAPAISGVQPLTCIDCIEEGGRETDLVMLTPENPIVILDAPQNVILRAKYTGPGLGMSEVWATIETNTLRLLPGQSGCLVHCCIPDPDSWVDTGERRCNITTGNYERMERDNCEKERWTVVEPITWIATGDIRCNHTSGMVEREETNQCDITRWVDKEPFVWIDTGDLRCDIVNDTRQKEQVNQCGQSQWIDDGPIRWVDGCETRCVDNLVEIKQKSDCGSERWNATAQPCGYLATLPIPCGGAAFRPGQQPPDATVELTDCDGNTIGYIFAEPRQGAAWPVTAGCAGVSVCDGDTVLGYMVEKEIPECAPNSVVGGSYSIDVLTQDTNTIDMSGFGSSASPIKAKAILNPAPDNQLQATASGLYVSTPECLVEFTTNATLVPDDHQKLWTGTGAVFADVNTLPVGFRIDMVGPATVTTNGTIRSISGFTSISADGAATLIKLDATTFLLVGAIE